MERLHESLDYVRKIGNNIYNHLMDDQSRIFFENRLAWWMTGNSNYIVEGIKTLPQIETWNKYAEIYREFRDKLIVYGACEDYQIFKLLYPNDNFFCFCDKNVEKQKNGWKGKKVISPEELLEKYKDYPILINASDYQAEIESFLLSNGVSPDNIYNKGKDIVTLYPIQYFDHEIMTPGPNEVFIDGGAYDLATARKFIEWCGGSYNAIYSFEPNSDNYKKCQSSLAANPIENLVLLNKGIWDCESVLHFRMAGEGSAVTQKQENTVEIETTSIDEVVGDNPVTFIKLDVEGSELKALQGAKNTIVRNRPKLAVCIYHKPEDIIEIPAYILSLIPDYKLYIRHYKVSYYETVLYAI